MLNPLPRCSRRRCSQVAKRYRAVAARIPWGELGNSFLRLCEAYESLQRPAKIAGEDGLIDRDEKIASLNEEAIHNGGKIVKAACDLSRELNIDFERNRFRAQLARQTDSETRLSADEIRQVLGPEVPEAELGQRLISAMDTFLLRLCEPAVSRCRPIQRLAVRFKDALFSELSRVGVADICEECGCTFLPTTKRKRFCSIDFEGRDCAARARNRRGYRKSRSGTRMSRSESGRKAAETRWSRVAKRQSNQSDSRRLH
jgi:hypothetical protein